VAKALLSGVPINNTLIKNRNDRILLLLSWLYDLNFSHTVARFRDDGIMDILLKVLPHVPLTETIRRKIRSDANRLPEKGLHESPIGRMEFKRPGIC
jgi:hypothetical protein